MNTDSIYSEAVRRLVDARRSGRPAPGADIALPDAAAAYAVQDAVAHAMGWNDPAPARHWKSGGADRDAVLTHAPLPAAGVWTSPATAGGWPFRKRGIEAEIALRLGRDVDAALAWSVGHDRAADLIDAMCVSIEIVDSRWQEGLDAPPLARLADLNLHGALVLGDWVPWQAQDWATQPCRLRIGNRLALERQGSHAMQDPAFVLPAWLRHATRDGATVAAGSVVTTGTWVGIVDALAGELVEVEFPGIGTASVQL